MVFEHIVSQEERHKEWIRNQVTAATGANLQPEPSVFLRKPRVSGCKCWRCYS